MADASAFHFTRDAALQIDETGFPGNSTHPLQILQGFLFFREAPTLIFL